jgi:hypothetical protein
VQIHQVRALSGYAANPVLGMLLVWLTLVIVHDRPAGTSRRLLFVAFGLIAGLAFWNSWLNEDYLLGVPGHLSSAWQAGGSSS